MTGQNMLAISTEKLSSFYVLREFDTQKVVKAVNDVDIEIRRNEIYGIAGESGCGKTTLLKTLFAMVEPPLQLMGGKVYYWKDSEKIDVFSLNQEEKRKLRWEYISYIPQGAMNVLNPVKRINITFRDFLKSHVRKQAELEAFNVLRKRVRELGLPLQVLDAYPHQLSGGMRQRVTIALAAILEPQIIICDEPTTALDVVAQRGVIQLLREIQERMKNSVVLVTHDMGVQANIADRIAIMYAGRIVEEARTEEIFDTPIHPYTQYLINSLPKFGDKTIRESAPGSPPSLYHPPTGCAFHPRCPYAFDLCSKEVPELIDVGGGHNVACWLVKKRGDDVRSS